MKRSTRNSLLLVLAAFLWGISFVSQSTGGSAIGSFSFNGIRSFIGTAVLIPVILFFDKKGLSDRRPVTKEDKKTLLKAGGLAGLALFSATTLQQIALTMGTPAGKAGFLTACYIVLVPILGIFLKKKCGWHIWICVVLAVIGLYFLCMTGGFALAGTDAMVIACAFLFATQILIVDHYVDRVDPIRMSALQFFVTGLLSLPFMIITETAPDPALWLSHFGNGEAWVALLYAGICSCGIAYTLQIVGQRDVNPTIASLLMSMESAFSVMAGFVLLGERLTGRQLAGCALIMAAVVLAQIPLDKLLKKRK